MSLSTGWTHICQLIPSLLHSRGYGRSTLRQLGEQDELYRSAVGRPSLDRVAAKTMYASILHQLRITDAAALILVWASISKSYTKVASPSVSQSCQAGTVCRMLHATTKRRSTHGSLACASHTPTAAWPCHASSGVDSAFCRVVQSTRSTETPRPETLLGWKIRSCGRGTDHSHNTHFCVRCSC